MLRYFLLGLRSTLTTYSPALWKALFVAYGGPYAVAAGLKIFQDCLAFLQPQLLRWLLAYISWYQNAKRTGITPNPLQGFAIALCMFIASVIQTVALNQYFQRTFETGMRVRAGLVQAIYNKALVLSNDERTRASGDIVNLMSVDATRLQDLCTYGLIAISGPLQVRYTIVSGRWSILKICCRSHWRSCLCIASLDGLLLSALLSWSFLSPSTLLLLVY